MRYSFPKEHRIRNATQRRCQSTRGDGQQCSLAALTSKDTCIVHTPGGQRHSPRCHCIRCNQKRRKETR